MMLLVWFLMLMALLAYFTQERKAGYSIALLACIGAWILWGIAYLAPVSSEFYLNDAVANLLAALVLFLGTLVIIFSWAYFGEEDGQYRLVALILLLMAFSIAVCTLADIFSLWLYFEGLALTSVGLVAFHHEDDLALEASFKYLVQSAMASSFILAGIALVFAQTGSLALSELHSIENSWIIAALFITGFGVKAAFVPLHTWLPDAHSQAPSGVSSMLSGFVIEVALIAMLRFMLVLDSNSGLMLMGFAALNILFGNFLALKQDELKRLLAFSSVAHLGYITLGFGIGIYAHEASAFEGAFFHLIAHGLMKALAFLAIGILVYLARGVRLRRVHLDGLGKTYPMLGFALSVALLALGGLPPMVGFFSKWQIFVGGAMTGDSWVLFFILFAAFGSILSLGFYAPLVTHIYRETVADTLKTKLLIPLWMRLPILILTALVVLLGLYPLLLSHLLKAAAIVFMGGQS